MTFAWSFHPYVMVLQRGMVRSLSPRFMKYFRRLLKGLGGFLLLVILWALLTPRPPLLEGISFSVQVLGRHNNLMRLSLAEDERYRVFTPLEAISPQLIEMTLLYEDRYFFVHPGVNLLAVLRAAWGTYASGERVLGASTITMQLARLRLNLDTRTITGKLRQMERALAYERYYSKRALLEAYLNLAPYGGNIEGCGAAAQLYYHKKASELSLPEIVSLVSVPQNPRKRNPLAVQTSLAIGHEDEALTKAQERLHTLWIGQHPEDKGGAFLSRTRLELYAPTDLPLMAPHVSSEAVMEYGGAGKEPVRTTLDYRLQKQLERHIRQRVELYRERDIHNMSAVLVHWPTREIRALVGSADFYNDEIEGQVDGTRAKRSPGSTLKPFIFALALEQGLIHPKTLLYDTPKSFGGYDPENADQQFKGPLRAEEALRQSRNIPAIYLASRLNSPDLYDFLLSADVGLPFNREHYGLALVLGGGDMSMRELASLYTILPNQGLYAPLTLFTTHDEPVPPRRLLSAEASLLTLDMLRATPYTQPGHISSMVRRVPMYWKTGTSNGYRDAWTAGIFGPYVLVVWAGNFDNTPNPHLVGITATAPLFWEIADALYTIEGFDDTAMRGLHKLNIKRIKVCSQTGDTVTTLCPDTGETYFIPGVSPIADSGVYREILIDMASGKRACVDRPGTTKRVVWEFWPTDLQQGFRQAGIAKPAPPPFLEECGAGATLWGSGPEILSPKEGVSYHRSLRHPQQTVIALRASGEADATHFFWFVGDEFIGKSLPGEPLIWVPPAGKSTLRVVDNFGRSSRRALTVELTD